MAILTHKPTHWLLNNEYTVNSTRRQKIRLDFENMKLTKILIFNQTLFNNWIYVWIMKKLWRDLKLIITLDLIST